MKKTRLVLSCGAAVLAGALCQTAHATIVLGTTYTSILADVNGTASGPEAITVSWDVTESGSTYTYSYTIHNPTGDVILGGQLDGKGETVDNFSVAFDTTALNAYVAGSISGGNFADYAGASTVNWAFTGVTAGSSSATLKFQSLMPPTLGNASASDANPPSPWGSDPNGQQVAVPVPEPTTILAGAMMLLPFGASTLRRVRNIRAV